MRKNLKSFQFLICFLKKEEDIYMILMTLLLFMENLKVTMRPNLKPNWSANHGRYAVRTGHVCRYFREKGGDMWLRYREMRIEIFSIMIRARVSARVDGVLGHRRSDPSIGWSHALSLKHVPSTLSHSHVHLSHLLALPPFLLLAFSAIRQFPSSASNISSAYVTLSHSLNSY